MRLRRDYADLGNPSTTLGGTTGRNEVAHPLIEEIRKAAVAASKLAESVGLGGVKRTVGRPQGAVSAPDRTAPSEPPRIRRVK